MIIDSFVIKNENDSGFKIRQTVDTRSRLWIYRYINYISFILNYNKCERNISFSVFIQDR